MSHYLFVHFKEKRTPDGEQVYFALSRDGSKWEKVNGGEPVLWAYYGDKGVRDFTVTRSPDGKKFYILATDLSLSYGMKNQYHNSWEEIGKNGSKSLSLWESEDLVHWSEQKLVKFCDDDFGCVWAPDVIYDRKAGEYILHWSSGHKDTDYRVKKIYYTRTRDFVSFTKPQVLYEKEDSGVIDSAMYEEDGTYYLFVKSDANPFRVILLKSNSITGPWERVKSFDESMDGITGQYYEAPTAFRREDGSWTLFLDFYGVQGAGQGYVPFTSSSLKDGRFTRDEGNFSFPYRFKHGTILSITEEEYDRIKDFSHWDLYE